MSRVPGIYAEWIPVLKEFAAGRDDEKTIPAMQQGRLHWCDIVAGRFASRLMAAFNARFDYIESRFCKAQDDGIPIEQALKQLDRDLDLLFQASQLQCLPEKEKQMLQDELQKTRQDMDDALEESAQQDPSGELAVLLRRRNKGSR
ncbi:hypothetical protein [Megasphaera sp. DJF_B143]|uniref:hypothetical protein n=1 Tax=Megasphaera sp. DJF_B143 TaxID=537288 RepID=UPI00073E7411|nr:hypothetical protein [Megasphaera sp. DJF_B143]KUH57174.1 hypothetical protein AT798_08835 [Megasphaera sp. DJF_B143]